MITTISEKGERVTIEIEGVRKVKDVSWPKAIQYLDEAYTEEIEKAVSQFETYAKATTAGLVQAANALDNMLRLCDELREKHLKNPGGQEDNDST